VISIVNPLVYRQALAEGVALLTRHWRLTVEMAKRDLAQRYAGQLMGAIWIVGHPLFLTALYVFLFSVVFKMKIGGTYELPLDYTAYMLAGLIPWLAFQAALGSSCLSIVSNSTMVKQFVFHLELLPAKDVLMALVTWLVGMPVVLVYVLASQQTAFATWLLLPFVLAIQVLAMLGAAFALSAVSVFFRDLKDFVILFASAGIFLMPIVYLPDMVPRAFRPLLYLNPFSYMIWVYQDVLYFGRIEHPVAWVVYTLGGVMAFALGYQLFRRLKPMFSSVL
jgi:lipopolysaccharide transport system permease protein